MRRWLKAAAVGVLGVGVAGRAWADDELSATRFDMVEREHLVDVRLARGTVKLTVRRKVQNTGPLSDQALWHLEAPPASVAVGLRTAVSKPNGELQWFDGELMEAKAAADKYRELTGIGGYYPKDPALLSWRSMGVLALQVFPVPARSEKVVEYTLLAPARYEEGAYRFELPELAAAGERSSLPPTLRVSAAPGDGVVYVNGAPTAAGAAFEARRGVTLELRPEKAHLVEGSLGVAAAGPGRVVTYARFAAAPRISRVPARASVVVVLDASRSMAGQMAHTFAAARSYLSHFPDAQVDVVTFDRVATRRTAKPVPAADALALLTGVPEPKNGSRVDDALALADSILLARAAAGETGERRVLLLTDFLTRTALSPTQVGALRSGAVLHLARVVDGVPALERDDADEWAPIAKRTGGVLWSAHHPAQVTTGTRAVFEEWARPLRVDHLRVLGVEAAEPWPTTLAEGQGVESWQIAKVAATAFSLRGRLWSTPISVRVEATAAAAKETAALVFGQALHGELSEPEMMALAQKGGAVSPVTSFLAIEPGVRPSTEGLDWGGLGLSGVGAGGGGVGSGIGLGSLGGRAFDVRAYLLRVLGPAVRRCGARTPVTVTFETTMAEVVDVLGVAAAPREARIETCVQDALWDLELPGGFAAPSSRVSLSVPPA